jgi:WD40 repeat protein
VAVGLALLALAGGVVVGGRAARPAGSAPPVAAAPTPAPRAPVWKQQASFRPLPGPGHVNVLALAPDGRTLALGAVPAVRPDGEGVLDAFAGLGAQLWDVRASRASAPLVRPADGARVNVQALAYSPDGKWLASSEGALYLWRLRDRTGQQARAPQGPVAPLAFAPDGKSLLAGNFDGAIHVLDMPGGRPRAVFRGHRFPCATAGFPPGGRTVVTLGAKGNICTWSLADGRALTTRKAPVEGAWTAVLAPDGGELFACSVGSPQVQSRDVDSGGRRLELACPSQPCALAIAANGKVIAAGCVAGTVLLWSARTGRPLARLEGHSAQIASLALAGDGRSLASADYRGEVKVWAAE